MQQLADVTADLMEENTTSTQASEMLEAESAERMRLEKELKDLQVGLDSCTGGWRMASDGGGGSNVSDDWVMLVLGSD